MALVCRSPQPGGQVISFLASRSPRGIRWHYRGIRDCRPVERNNSMALSPRPTGCSEGQKAPGPGWAWLARHSSPKCKNSVSLALWLEKGTTRFILRGCCCYQAHRARVPPLNGNWQIKDLGTRFNGIIKALCSCLERGRK